MRLLSIDDDGGKESDDDPSMAMWEDDKRTVSRGPRWS